MRGRCKYNIAIHKAILDLVDKLQIKDTHGEFHNELLQMEDLANSFKMNVEPRIPVNKLKEFRELDYMDVYNSMKKNGTTSYRRRKSSKPKKAKSTFRTGESQGRGMIRNMNKITGTAVKRFK